MKNCPDPVPFPSPDDAPNADQTESLRANKLVESIRERIRESIKRTNDDGWAIGDALIELLKLPYLAKRGQNYVWKAYFSDVCAYSTLCYYRITAERFGPEDRARAKAEGWDFRSCYEMSLGREKNEAAGIVKADEGYGRYFAAAAPQRHKAKLNHRQITKPIRDEFVKAAKEEAGNRADEYLASRQPGDWLKDFVLGDCLKFMASGRIAPESLRGAWFDPPYIFAQKGGARKNAFNSAQGCRTTGNLDRDSAIELYVKGIAGLSPLINPTNGWLIVWAAGGEPDEPAVIEALRRAEFKYLLPLAWEKTVQAGGQYPVYATSTERILLCAKSRKALFDWSPTKDRKNARAQILRGHKEVTRQVSHDVRARRKKATDVSIYEKPVSICREFLENISLANDLIYDVCGCTASMVEACIQLKRRWLYTEVNAENYKYGLNRIRHRMEGETAEAEKPDEEPPEAAVVA